MTGLGRRVLADTTSSPKPPRDVVPIRVFALT
jgi:hypothetical protein